MVNQYGVFLNENYTFCPNSIIIISPTWAKLALPNLRLYTKLNRFFNLLQIIVPV